MNCPRHWALLYSKLTLIRPLNLRSFRDTAVPVHPRKQNPFKNRIERSLTRCQNNEILRFPNENAKKREFIPRSERSFHEPTFSALTCSKNRKIFISKSSSNHSKSCHFSYGAAFNFGTSYSKWSTLFPGIRSKLTTLSLNTLLPLSRELVLGKPFL